MSNLSPGLASSCFELLDYVARTRLTLQDIRSAFSRFGVMSIEEVIDFAFEMHWIARGTDDEALLTESGKRLHTIAKAESRFRQALLDYIDLKQPVWLQNAAFGRKRLLSFVNNQIYQVFLEAAAITESDDETVAFWDMIAARARGQRDSYLLAIGRTGERLSLEHERDRTGVEAKWIALENNADGYDLLSVVDRSFSAPLTIEVKTTSVGTRSSFSLSRHEWERAVLSEHHVFHLWDISGRPHRLAVVVPSAVKSHVPSDCGNGEWQVAKIPFACFDTQFANCR